MKIEPNTGRRCLSAPRGTAPRDVLRGHVGEGFYGTDELGFKITRADVAAFVAAQVGDDRYVGRAPAISN